MKIHGFMALCLKRYLRFCPTSTTLLNLGALGLTRSSCKVF